MYPRLSIRSHAAIVLLAAFSVWITWRAKALELGVRHHEAPSALSGKAAPEFSLESLDGRKFSLADYRGKTLVVSFWASWCGPCRIEMPLLAAFYQQTHSSHADFEMLAISIDSDRDAAANAAKTLRIPFPVVLDPDNRVSDSYGVDSIPMMFIIDRTGKVTHSHVGFEPGLDMVLAEQVGIKDYTPNYNFRTKAGVKK
jgi:peroxiredoxin